MPAPQPLEDQLNAARASVARAYSISALNMAKSAESFLGTALSYVVPTDGIDDLHRDALSRIREFAAELDDGNGLPRKADDAVENARQLALLSIDRLEEALTDAKPNDMARALNIDWI